MDKPIVLKQVTNKIVSYSNFGWDNMHLKSKKHVLNLVGVAAVGCELEVVWLFYSRLRSAGKHLLCYYSLLYLLPA